jgi:hypothetical protein
VVLLISTRIAQRARIFQEFYAKHMGLPLQGFGLLSVLTSQLEMSFTQPVRIDYPCVDELWEVAVEMWVGFEM